MRRAGLDNASDGIVPLELDDQWRPLAAAITREVRDDARSGHDKHARLLHERDRLFRRRSVERRSPPSEWRTRNAIRILADVSANPCLCHVYTLAWRRAPGCSCDEQRSALRCRTPLAIHSLATATTSRERESSAAGSTSASSGLSDSRTSSFLKTWPSKPGPQNGHGRGMAVTPENLDAGV